MKRPIITLAILVVSSFVSIAAGNKPNEPCKDMFIPSELRNDMITFEIPTYDEYVYDIVLESTMLSVTVDEENILNETVYNEIRNNKIKEIKENYNFAYMIMSKLELKKIDMSGRYVFKEKVISNLVSEEDSKFEKYTEFVVEDRITNTSYKIADPNDKAYSECLVGKENYKYVDIISIL